MSLTCQMTVGGDLKPLPGGGQWYTPVGPCGKVAVAMTVPTLNSEASFPVCKMHRNNLDKLAERIKRPKCVPLESV